MGNRLLSSGSSRYFECYANNEVIINDDCPEMVELNVLYYRYPILLTSVVFT